MNEQMEYQEPAEAGFFMPEAQPMAGEYLPADNKGIPPKLARFIDADNIADGMDDDELAKIGDRVIREYDIDNNSRAEWLEQMRAGLALASQKPEVKNYPWPKAASVKYPLTTTAAIQFAARAYPSIVPGPDLVKCGVNGQDLDGQKRQRADRVAAHMSWQFMEEMDEWESDTDRLLVILPIIGVCFRKTYFSKTLDRNCSELVLPDKLVVNFNAKSLTSAPRITQEIDLYPHEIEERIRSKQYLEHEYSSSSTDSDGDDDALRCYLEQHRLLDLDKDGYPEPYCVTVHKESGKVVRIKARYTAEGVQHKKGKVVRIQPVHYYTLYGFIPNPESAIYHWGYGVLLGPMNETVNVTLNMLMDAGHLQTVGGGFIGRGTRMPSGPMRFKPGEWKKVDASGGTVRDSIVPLPAPGPSAVLFSLLELLIGAGKEISSIKDLDIAPNAPAAAVIARIQEAAKINNSIFKRVYRAMRNEIRLQYELNGLYAQPQTYFNFNDQEGVVYQQDYQTKDLNLSPAADPVMASETQNLARAEALMGLRMDPLINGQEVLKRYLERLGEKDIEALMAEPPEGTPPDMMAKIAELELKERELQLKEREIEMKSKQADNEAEIKAYKTMAEIQKIKADAIKSIAEAEAIELGSQIDAYRTQIDALTAEFNMQREVETSELQPERGESGSEADGSGQGMVAAPQDSGVPTLPAGLAGRPEGVMGGGGIHMPPVRGDGDEASGSYGEMPSPI